MTVILHRRVKAIKRTERGENSGCAGALGENNDKFAMSGCYRVRTAICGDQDTGAHGNAWCSTIKEAAAKALLWQTHGKITGGQGRPGDFSRVDFEAPVYPM